MKSRTEYDAAGRIRTDDRSVNSRVLYQLSYNGRLRVESPTIILRFSLYFQSRGFYHHYVKAGHA